MHQYKIAGLSVESEVALPGVILATANGSAPEVTIAGGSVPMSLDDAGATGPTWQMSHDKFLLRIPDLVRFLFVGGREIRFEVENGTPTEDIVIFLLGTAFGILLHQRGQIVLHASAVAVGGAAVLFCGPSGAGKSTLAAALTSRGYPLVADDFCAITLPAEGAPMAQPDGRRLKLWAAAIKKLDLAESLESPIRNQIEKFYVKPAKTSPLPLRIGAVYFLRETKPPHGSGIERPNVVDAALMLKRNAYRPKLVHEMQQKEEYFRAAAVIAEFSCIHYLTRPLDFTAMQEVVAWLEDHWHSIDLTRSAR